MIVVYRRQSMLCLSPSPVENCHWVLTVRRLSFQVAYRPISCGNYVGCNVNRCVCSDGANAPAVSRYWPWARLECRFTAGHCCKVCLLHRYIVVWVCGLLFAFLCLFILVFQVNFNYPVLPVVFLPLITEENIEKFAEPICVYFYDLFYCICCC